MAERRSAPKAPPRALELTPEPATRRQWLADVWDHRAVLLTLAVKDFQVRYKRAVFGVLWAVAVPLLQGIALAIVFSRFVPVHSDLNYSAFVVSGVLPFSYFGQTLGAGATAIVDGSGLADKVWFPRALLPLTPVLANLVGLMIALTILLGSLPVLGEAPGPRFLLVLPGTILMVTFTASLCLVLSALHVYFRDVRFLVQATLLMLFYVTPVAYPLSAVGRLGPWLELNPLTGVISVFHTATTDAGGPVLRPALISVVTTFALTLTALALHRRRDRLFVDLL